LQLPARSQQPRLQIGTSSSKRGNGAAATSSPSQRTQQKPRRIDRFHQVALERQGLAFDLCRD
jgi:hypothetical protein